MKKPTPNWKSGKRGGGGGLALLLTFLFAATPAASQTGTITGVVRDVATGQTLESALVRLDGAESGVLTNQDGRYLVIGVSAGSHELTVTVIGYGEETVSANVVAGETTVLDVELTGQAIRMQDLVVTGVARATPRVKLPFTVEKVDVASAPVTAVSAESFLVGKVPGVKVVRGSGQPGTTGDILLRAATSITGDQSPLVIIDGVISNTAFDDLSSLDIESIEVVKGAAGASLYGSRAANGVVQIRTKRGSGFGGRDYSRIIVTNDVGQDRMYGRIALSQNHPWKLDASGNLIDVAGNVISDITDPDVNNPDLNGESVHTSFQDGAWPSHYPAYDQLERIFSPGSFMTNAAATEGRNGSTNYRASFSRNVQTGVLPDFHDGFGRKAFRLNVDHEVRNNLNVSLSTAYSQRNREDFWDTPWYEITFMPPYVDLLARDPSSIGKRHCPPQGCLYVHPDPINSGNVDNPLYNLELIDYRDRLQTITASANIRWTPLAWMDIEGLIGMDRNSRAETNVIPAGLEQITADPRLGYYSKFQDHDQDVNAEVTLSVNKAFGDLATRTRVRYSQENSAYDQFRGEGEDFLAADIPRLNNLDPETHSADSWMSEVVAENYYLISALDYKGKYILDGMVRRDGSSLFGENERWHTYGRGSAAWRLSQESWWPFDDVNEFKLRYSLGSAGRRPYFWAQYETYSVSGGTITPVTLGNKDLRPQKTLEAEYGLEMVLFNRVNMGVTYADVVSSDQILSVPLPKAGGFTSQWQNAGTLESSTLEGFLEAPIIETENMGWSVRVNVDRTRQQITELNRPPYRQSFFYYREGEVFGAFYGAKWARTCAELPAGAPCDQFQVNDDGLLVWTGSANYTDGISSGLWGTNSAGQTGDDVFGWGQPVRVFGECETRRQGGPGCKDFLYMGNTTPDVNVSLMNNFRWKGLNLYVLLDGEFGADIYNRTRQWAYRDNRSGDQDQAGKAEGMKKPVSYYQTLYNTNAVNDWFVEEGSFVKVREVSVRYSVNPDWLDSFFGGRVTGVDVNLIGRNLFTFTNYRGYDPEVGTSDPDNGNNGGSDVIGRIDNYAYPNFRNFSASLEVIF